MTNGKDDDRVSKWNQLKLDVKNRPAFGSLMVVYMCDRLLNRPEGYDIGRFDRVGNEIIWKGAAGSWYASWMLRKFKVWWHYEDPHPHEVMNRIEDAVGKAEDQ